MAPLVTGRMAVLALCAAGVAACGGSGTSTPPPPALDVTITEPLAYSLVGGRTVRVTASVTSTHQLVAIVADLDGRTTALAFRQVLPTGALEWAGTLDLGGMPEGAGTLLVTATDVLGKSTAALLPVTIHQPLHAISGSISPGYLGYLATAVLSGPVNATVAISSSGTFQFADLPDGTYTVTPTASDRVFEPKSQTLTLAGASAPPLEFGLSGDWQQDGPAPGVGSPDYLAIWGSFLVDVGAVGTAGGRAYWDGLGWSTFAVGAVTLRGIAFSNPGEQWEVGDGGTVQILQPGRIVQAVPSGTSVALRGVCLAPVAADKWMVGDGGTILHWDGTALAPQASGTAADLQAVGCSSATNAFAVGAGGTILRWNGSAWAAEASGTTATLRAVLVEPAVAYAVGDGGTILRRSGGAWVRESSGTTADLTGVTRGSSTAAGSGPIVVGAGGTILRTGRGGWVAEESHTTETLRAVWGSFAVGDRGTVLRRRVYGTP